jgi:soluble lytic murein transglycosylase-like protein
MIRGLTALSFLVMLGDPLSAEVRVVKRPNGSTYVYNVRTRNLAKAAAIPNSRAALASEELTAMVNRHARGVALEPKLVNAVIQVESAFNSRARSYKGAMGLMQLMPETAAIYSVSDPYDPEQNIGAGTKYLKRLIDSLGGLELGLAGYNAGPGAVKRFGGVPPYPETRDYVEKVMRLYKGDSQYSLASSSLLRPGRKTYLRRDASGRLVMTTSPPSG